PRLSTLASEGMRFAQYYANAPVCSPTRVSTLSGSYPLRYGFSRALSGRSRRGMPGRVVTLAEYLETKGYATGHFGKWHIGESRPEFRPTAQGFDTSLIGTKHPSKPDNFRSGRPSDYFDTTLLRDDTTVILPTGEHLTKVLTDHAIEFVDNHRAAPFFLNLWYYAPHWPHQPPATWEALYDGMPYASYAGLLSHTDFQIGRLLDHLQAEGLAGTTLVFVASDNGGAPNSRVTNDPLQNSKFTVFEGGIRVPMMVRYPGMIPTNVTSNAVTASMDILPTIAALLGDPPSAVDTTGVSFASALRGETWTRSTTLFWQFKPEFSEIVESPEGYLNTFAVRSADWKLLMANRELHLFDLSIDVQETNNVIAAHAAMAESMLADYDAWRSYTSRIDFRVASTAGSVTVNGSSLVFSGPARAEFDWDPLFDSHDGDFSCRFGLTPLRTGVYQRIINKEASWRLRLSNTDLLQLEVTRADGSGVELTGVTPLQLGQRHDVVISFYGLESGPPLIRVYVDGFLQFSEQPVAVIQSNDNTIVVSRDDHPNWLNAEVDNIELYAAALTARDLQ
ncbi:sulfatase-like hydrolase/transferase, partial [Myxococcota bacterium]